MATQTPCLWVLGFFVMLLFQDIVEIVALSPTYRTAYHFQPPKNWMNDPNGPLVYKNLYHLFYQYNPKGPDWGNIVWAHSTSNDLVNWTPHRAAIFPTQKGDINGCYSGSATILPGGKPALLYTGNSSQHQEVQNVAFPKNLSDPLLLDWAKPTNDPVITPRPLSQVDASEFRDPTTAWLGPDGEWRIIVGNKIGRDGRALLYKSKDFVHWIKVQEPLHQAKDTGMWECPDFYPVSSIPIGLDTSTLKGFGIKHVLKVSQQDAAHDHYVIGTYNNEKDVFVPDVGADETNTGLRYDYGKFYASKTFYDSLKKRRILWGWVNESLAKADYINQGWSGIQGVPRVIWLDKFKKQLLQRPIREIETLRADEVSSPRTLLKGGSTVEIHGVNAAQADVDVTFDLTRIVNKAEVWNPKWSDPQLLCRQKDASIKGEVKQIRGVAMQRPKQIDHSVVESFGANGKGVITSRVYPTKAIGKAAHLYVFNHGIEDVEVSSLSAWTMNKAYIN